MHTAPETSSHSISPISLAQDIVRQNANAFAESFYRLFLDHTEASAYLTHTVVQQRLTQSLNSP